MHPDLYKATALSVTAFGLLSVAGLLVSGLATQNVTIVILALLSAGSSYIAMFVVMLALNVPESVGVNSVARLVNPTMTLLAIVFWVAGLFQLWG